MSKPYTESDFSQLLISDRTWRLKEISDLKNSIVQADSILKKVLLRALVTICYAHWEGHIRFSAKIYLVHIALRKFPFLDLNGQFLKNYFLPRLAALSTSKPSLAAKCDLLEDIFSSSHKRFSRVNDDLVNTKSNLNSDVLRDICLVCGVPFKKFEDRVSFIDILLLKRRNAIAHGEDAFVDPSDMDELATKTISLMRTFGDILENNVYLKVYRAPET